MFLKLPHSFSAIPVNKYAFSYRLPFCYDVTGKKIIFELFFCQNETPFLEVCVRPCYLVLYLHTWPLQEGNGIANLYGTATALQALKTAGFEILDCKDRAEEGDEPWYATMVGRNLCSLQTFRASWIGRMVTHAVVMAMEGVGIAPRGSISVHNMLLRAADNLVEGGRLGIFTPLYLVVAKKPMNI